MGLISSKIAMGKINLTDESYVQMGMSCLSHSLRAVSAKVTNIAPPPRPNSHLRTMAVRMLHHLVKGSHL